MLTLRNILKIMRGIFCSERVEILPGKLLICETLGNLIEIVGFFAEGDSIFIGFYGKLNCLII